MTIQQKKEALRKKIVKFLLRSSLYIDVGRSSHPGKRGLKKHMHQAVTAGLERGMRVYRRYDWTRQLDEILEQGYQLGPLERKKAVDRVSALTGWPRQVCWDRARKLGLSRHRPAPVRRWAAKEEEYLLSFLGSKSIRQIARRLGRSESAIRTKLKFLSRAGRTLSARVSDGHTDRKSVV